MHLLHSLKNIVDSQIFILITSEIGLRSYNYNNYDILQNILPSITNGSGKPIAMSLIKIYIYKFWIEMGKCKLTRSIAARSSGVIRIATRCGPPGRFPAGPPPPGAI